VIKRIPALLLLFVFLPAAAQNAAQITAQDAAAWGETPPAHITGGHDRDAILAADEFRIGIQAYNRFAFNEAIMSFERALSFRPGEAIIMDWLGRAYYRSGFENTALRQWRAALEAYGADSPEGIIIRNRIETVANRRHLFPIADDNVRYIEAARFYGRQGEGLLFRQPTSAVPLSDGSIWVVAFGSNELVRLGVNGTVLERIRGPLQGFDRPYDMVIGPDGRMYVSEHRGGRISMLDPHGRWMGYIGSRGLGPGNLVGPQNLAIDEDGYLYVNDFGNNRISKFDPDGVFILSFGQRGPDFPGFLVPTGIAARNGRVFVADSATGQIHIFDPNGTYLGVLVENLTRPESLRFTSDGRLLVADENRILLIDTGSAIVRELGTVGNRNVRISGADIDANGNLLAVNFAANEVSLLTRFDDLASGFFVQIERISADRFPLVTAEIRVEDRMRRPIVGLEGLNFILTENGRQVTDQTFHIPAHRINRADISVLVERSPETANLRDDLAVAMRDINSALGTNTQIVSVVSAAENPRRERWGESSAALEAAARGEGVPHSARWRFDQALRLAAGDLHPGEKKRSVVYIGTGSLGIAAFDYYSLSEMAAYLANNAIIFNAVIIGGGLPSPEILYLARETGGEVQALFRPRGIREMIESIAFAPSGLYSISFRSSLPTDFGRAWLPLEAEVYLKERSGRDSSGFFPPLE